MYSLVTEYIRQRIFVPEEALQEAFTYCTLRHFRKGDYVLREGEYCRFIGFLNAGLIVSTFVGGNGKDVVCNFFFEDQFFTHVESLNHPHSSTRSFIAVENCDALMLDKEDLSKIFAIHPAFETLFNRLILEDLQRMLVYEQEKRTQTVEERYLYIQKIRPDLLERAPLKIIAGYLGVEPPSLSRLRKRLVKR
ncbi:Crp/Fnr family transcriptional regulator [Dinghuibacter silviterrae]|uniref:CRP-like cAMP-binding protein n=1 Tax=Dinghuibacter silviterrae TaxID=1539049 RepID=A0A4R8DR15_9BACT|nr:Crp/Fnr family transcriptional regulator [Dinghuibacter silviterrae]TDX00614.1 CRP-like cAMP-binding protein [Dinghuibacter silviterrae]